MNIIKRYFYSYCRYVLRKEKESFLFKTIQLASFNRVANEIPVKGNTVAFVIPEIGKTAGGGSSILRIGTYLSKHGFNVLYVVYNSNDLKRIQLQATNNIGHNNLEFLCFDDAQKLNFDIVIATSWPSVYYAKMLNGYKCYFVQDYEPLFYEVGDEYYLAKSTYELGFHMICLGEWNKKKIMEQCKDKDIRIDSIEFPYEPSEYKLVKRDYSSYMSKKTFKLAVYIKKTGRRVPLLTQCILLRCKEMFKANGLDLDISFYGLNAKEKVLVGNNLGRLTKKELFELYSQADFGMVASMTNISLVPFEMLATGLPVIEFKEGSYSFFLGDDTAILIDMQADSLYSQLKKHIESPNLLDQMMNRAHERISALSWDKSCQQFVEIINHLY